MTRSKGESKRVAGASRRPQIPARLENVVIADALRLINWPNVRQIELGWKERKGRVTSTLSVKIHVAEKTDAIEPHHRLPKSTRVLIPTSRGTYRALRVPTDVVWHSPARLISTPADFLNPILSGAMIGVPGANFGTYAGVVTNASGQRFHLTAGHVVQSFPGSIAANLPVLQPPVPGGSVPAGGTPQIGETADGFVGNKKSGFIDFALIAGTPVRAGTSRPFDGAVVVPKVLPSAAVVSGPTRISKFGASTGRTHAIFSSVVPATVVGGLFVTNVLAFKGTDDFPFGDEGDSGALVVSNESSSDGMIVGLLFAVSAPTPDAPAGRGLVVPFDRLPVRPAK